MEVKARVGSDSNVRMITSNATRSWKELKKQNRKYQKVTKGDVIDLREFLFTEYRDYLVRYNDKTRVPIHTLEEKVVALYFYEESLCSSKEEIVRVYEELAKIKENFEVVLIYLTDTSYTYNCTNEESFWKSFKTMPWLALPFKDPNKQKLKRVFEFLPAFHEDDYDQRPSLIIFGPHGEFIEPLGHRILGVYPVYPFTREKVAKLETEKVQNLKLEKFWDPNTVFRRIDGSQMRFSQLAGKRVVLFFECEKHEDCEYRFLIKLKEKYLELKGTDDEFEVIHISLEVKCILPIKDLPWLVSYECELLPGSFHFYECYGDNHFTSTFLAFDQDGKLVRTIYPVFENTDFPFYAGSMEEETLSQITKLFEWDYWTYYPKKGRIYTYHKKK